MKKSLLVRLIILLVATFSLSACVIWPYGWDDDYHHGGGWHDRGRHEGHRDHWDRD